MIKLLAKSLMDGVSGGAEIDLKRANKIGANRWFVIGK